MLSLITALVFGATPVIFADATDQRTLLPKKLVNRSLSTQLDEFRLGQDLGLLTMAADVQIGTQAPLDGMSPTPFHGFFVSDVYIEAQVIEGLDINLNLLMLNTTASGGYRVLADLLPGLAAHLHLDVATLLGDPVSFNFVTPDLDLVTLGEGLLVETIPLEGFMGALAWRGLEFRSVFGGRVFWQTDDLLHFSLRALDGAIGLGLTQWWSGYMDEPAEFEPKVDGRYAHIFGRWQPLPGLTLAGEYGARVTTAKPFAHSGLARADLLHRAGQFAFHVGYQARYYGQGFGPFDSLTTPSTIMSTPNREDYYATNSYEYLWLTPYFDQYSHTVVFEGQYHIGKFNLFAELEWWVRMVSDVQEPSRLVKNRRGDSFPGVLTQTYYKVGAALMPFPALPHRIAVYLSNKAVTSYQRVTIPVVERFIQRPILFVEAEVHL